MVRFVFAAGGAVALVQIRPLVTLTKDEVFIPASPDELLAEFKRRFAASPHDVLAVEDHRLVRRFAGTEGRFSFRTVEVVTYQTDAITFEHLAGPFAECNERFEFVAVSSGTRVIHSGSYRLRGGLWTGALAFGPVKRAFETHVRGHLEAMAAEFDPLA
jgi:hypothetical protein